MTSLLHRRLPEVAQTLPHLRLGTPSTPVAPMPLGLPVDVWCKDEGR